MGLWPTASLLHTVWDLLERKLQASHITSDLAVQGCCSLAEADVEECLLLVRRRWAASFDGLLLPLYTHITVLAAVQQLARLQGKQQVGVLEGASDQRICPMQG